MATKKDDEGELSKAIAKDGGEVSCIVTVQVHGDQETPASCVEILGMRIRREEVRWRLQEARSRGSRPQRSASMVGSGSTGPIPRPGGCYLWAPLQPQGPSLNLKAHPFSPQAPAFSTPFMDF